MNHSVIYDELIGVLDDAVGLADEAVKSAELAQKSIKAQSEPVTLVKVASSRYAEVAKSLIQTGAFKDYTEQGLINDLEKQGTAGHLVIMEKLASRAVFPLDDSSEDDSRGDLVEKSSTSRTNDSATETRTSVWRRALDEAEAECAGY